jgi:hypothetical protein
VRRRRGRRRAHRGGRAAFLVRTRVRARQRPPRTQAGVRPGAAPRRAAAVWTFGLAVNQPISVVTLPLSFRRLRRSGATYWDAVDGLRVDHGTIGGGRATIAILIVAAFFAFQVAVASRSLDG